MEISESAKLIANLCILQSSNKQEAIVLLTETIQYIAQLPKIDTTFGVNVADTTKINKEPIQKVVLARAGSICSCSNCGANVYRLDKDLYDKMKVEEFCNCFAPLANAPKLTPPINFQMIDDAALTDCPICKAELSLLLWGKRKLKANSTDKQDYTAVGSVGPDVL